MPRVPILPGRATGLSRRVRANCLNCVNPGVTIQVLRPVRKSLLANRCKFSAGTVSQ
jgi:hypothetical protein